MEYFFIIGCLILIVSLIVGSAGVAEKVKESKKVDPQEVQKNLRYVAWNKTYKCDVVGESYYQKALSLIAGPKEKDSKLLDCTAVLIRDPWNKHDPNAVVVTIDGQQVGHLSKTRAAGLVREMEKQGLSSKIMFVVQARIQGGWKNSYSEGSYGVILDFPPANRLSSVISPISMEDSEVRFKNRLK